MWNVLTGMGIGLRTDVVELDNVAALETALNGALAGDLRPLLAMLASYNCAKRQAYSQPVDNVGVGRVASATGILLIASTVDEDGVLQRSYSHISLITSHNLGTMNIPLREASRGFMSNMSMPRIFPSNSKRSRPVACSRSLGT